MPQPEAPAPTGTAWLINRRVDLLMIIAGGVGISAVLYVATQFNLGFLYLALISQFFAFFAWYQGMALGGVARVGQVQLLLIFDGFDR